MSNSLDNLTVMDASKNAMIYAFMVSRFSYGDDKLVPQKVLDSFPLLERAWKTLDKELQINAKGVVELMLANKLGLSDEGFQAALDQANKLLAERN